jgi:hypothetical protein
VYLERCLGQLRRRRGARAGRVRARVRRGSALRRLCGQRRACRGRPRNRRLARLRVPPGSRAGSVGGPGGGRADGAGVLNGGHTPCSHRSRPVRHEHAILEEHVRFACKLSTSGRLAVVACVRSTCRRIHVLDASAGYAAAAALAVHSSATRSLDWSADGRHLMSADRTSVRDALLGRAARGGVRGQPSRHSVGTAGQACSASPPWAPGRPRPTAATSTRRTARRTASCATACCSPPTTAARRDARHWARPARIHGIGSAALCTAAVLHSLPPALHKLCIQGDIVTDERSCTRACRSTCLRTRASGRPHCTSHTAATAAT